MKKNVYSITLLEDVVRAVDRVAYLNGTSRSGMINRILAEYVSMSTPETHARRIFSELGRMIESDNDFRIHAAQSDTLFAVKSSLSFKYNPTIRYSVALYSEADEFFGELRAVLRTQNPMLISQVGLFFEMWERVETAYSGTSPRVFLEAGKYTRCLRMPHKKADATEIGSAAAGYIRVLHDGISAYFESLPDTERATARISDIYRRYVSSGAILI